MIVKVIYNIEIAISDVINFFFMMKTTNSEEIDSNSRLKKYRIAFKMQLYKGFEAEYKKRHDALWPELKQLLKSKGISEYSIFLDEKTNSLFSIMKAENPEALNELPSNPVMQKWWDYMHDIMETNSDNSPISVTLKEVFYLP